MLNPVLVNPADVLLGMLPLARELLRRGAQRVVLAANATPTINDVTADELAPLLEAAGKLDTLIGSALQGGRLSVVSSGNDIAVIDLRKVSCCPMLGERRKIFNPGFALPSILLCVLCGCSRAMQSAPLASATLVIPLAALISCLRVQGGRGAGVHALAALAAGMGGFNGLVACCEALSSSRVWLIDSLINVGAAYAAARASAACGPRTIVQSSP